MANKMNSIQLWTETENLDSLVRYELREDGGDIVFLMQKWDHEQRVVSTRHL